MLISFKADVKRHWESRAILTLDPAKLVSKQQPIYDISNLKDVWFGFRTIGGQVGPVFGFPPWVTPEINRSPLTLVVSSTIT